MSSNHNRTMTSYDSNDNMELVFTKSDHKTYLISKFLNYLQQGFLCDIVFTFNNEQIKRRINAHRLVLSTLSENFRLLLENSKQNEIILNNIDPEIFEKLVYYAYNGILKINSKNVKQLVDLANKFHLVDIVDACCQFIKKEINLSNCFSLHQFSLENQLNDLIEITWLYILDNFSRLIENNPEFLQLSFNEIKQILESDDINVQCEEIVYEALIRWIDHDFTHRNRYIGELFNLIRLPLINRKYLTDYIDGNQRFENNNSCQLLIIEAMRYHLTPERRSTMKTIRTKPRKSTLGALFYLGGNEGTKYSQIIEKYDFRTESWKQTDIQLVNHRCQFACILLDNKLYVCGGRDSLKTLSTVEIFDFRMKTWTNGTSMINQRQDFSIESLGGPIYAVGGYDGRTTLNTVERFDRETSQWTYVASMGHSRSTFGIAVLENRIYVVGGKDVSISLREMEFYDPHTNRWSQCASMKKCRENVAATSCNGYIYAVGGRESLLPNKNLIRHDDIERYDPKCNQWTLISSLTRAKESLALAVVNNKLYVAGGYDGKILNEIEEYDIECDQWKKCHSSLVKRTGAWLIHIPNVLYS